MTEPTARPTRAQQRRQTEDRILTAARQLFAERGYDRTTIRAVASSAGVDAGLVMHYFGSKDLLFARVTETAPAPDVFQAATGGGAGAEAGELYGGTPDEATEALLTSLGRRLTDEPESSLAVLRSMLTNADAADRYRTAAQPQLDQLTEAIPAPDADLRASLLSAIIHGVIAERYLLRLTNLADASPEQIITLLRPCFESLTTAPADDAADGQG
ncbi:TetR/AcrR family transcriptional regulator [Winogradskya humida]|uniref:TetR family transcriptional regulator n=1 Tax=Winogradskya humida TaxID=113566 RepID=A0ABQ3ZF85_9ACTN|nr:TetR/AcrR family transcriptional regulator [Actinoplanes humidus]GIE17235.1 TetR family transcriptional regulator [Actinoplanes humidus]